jgi:hypothetical protein
MSSAGHRAPWTNADTRSTGYRSTGKRQQVLQLERMSLPNADATRDQPSEPVVATWVVEGVLDVPIHVQVPADKQLKSGYISLGGEQIDGFVEFRPKDLAAATTSRFWTRNEPTLYECRAGVTAPDAFLALIRGGMLYEHVADRLMLFTGYAVRVLSVGFVYNEDELRECQRGLRKTFNGTTGGEQSVRTQPPKNRMHPSLFHPPEGALDAIRWFRTAMSATRAVDQFLSYYISLESIATHVPGIAQQPRSCIHCGGDLGFESKPNAGIKQLIARHPQLPAKTRKELARIRAQIAHGSGDWKTAQAARLNLPLVQRLAADGIALVLGIDPSQLNFMIPFPQENMIVPMLEGDYGSDTDPSTRWGGLLSDALHRYVRHVSTGNA